MLSPGRSGIGKRTAHAQIDWARGHDFLDKELRQALREAAVGTLHVDLLARVTGTDANEHWLYVHVEVQTQRDDDFARRMFTYNHRLMERWGRSGPSFAVLADDSPTWRPVEFRFAVLGCEHTLRFPVAKLLDHEHRLAALRRESNPFALVTAAHLSALRTRGRMGRRFAAKRALVQLLYTQGWSRERVIELFLVIDWMLALPKPLERTLWQDIDEFERRAGMRYVSSVERLGVERGWIDGKREGRNEGRLETLARLMTRRFGPLPESALARLKAATPEQLDAWTDRVLDAPSLDGMFGGH